MLEAATDAPLGDPIYRLVIPRATPTLNVLLRMHFGAVKKLKAAMAWELRVALRESGAAIRPPLTRARLMVERRAYGLADYDGLVGGMKPLIDCLLPEGEPHLWRGKKRVPHPFGIGLLLDDSPAHMVLIAKGTRVARSEPLQTVLTVWEIG